MDDLASLHINKRRVTSPFGLLGTDENALSFALGYTFQQCLPFLQWFLQEIGIPSVHPNTLRKARIALQRGDEFGSGITDIEIFVEDKIHVIIEAKVGLAIPSIEQCRKYLKRLRESNARNIKLVALVQSPDQTFVKQYVRQDPKFSSRLVSFNWSRLISECVRMIHRKSDSSTKSWIRSFYHFLDQEYGMKAFSTEVWILSIKTKPLWTNGMSHWDIHQKHRVWWSYNEHAVRPLYIAFRVNGTLDSICRVNQIEHEIPIIHRVPEMKHIPDAWPSLPCTIWHFEKAVKLPKPIRTGAGMYNRRVRCDLDLLLSCETVLEIEQEMKNRRDQKEM